MANCEPGGLAPNLDQESEQTVDLNEKYNGYNQQEDQEASQDDQVALNGHFKQIENIDEKSLCAFGNDHVINHNNNQVSCLKNHLNDTPRTCKFQKNENGSPGFNGSRNYLSYNDEDGEEEDANENDEDTSELDGKKKITYAQDECNSIAAPLEQQS